MKPIIIISLQNKEGAMILALTVYVFCLQVRYELVVMWYRCGNSEKTNENDYFVQVKWCIAGLWSEESIVLHLAHWFMERGCHGISHISFHSKLANAQNKGFILRLTFNQSHFKSTVSVAFCMVFNFVCIAPQWLRQVSTRIVCPTSPASFLRVACQKLGKS